MAAYMSISKLFYSGHSTGVNSDSKYLHVSDLGFSIYKSKFILGEL